MWVLFAVEGQRVLIAHARHGARLYLGQEVPEWLMRARREGFGGLYVPAMVVLWAYFATPLRQAGFLAAVAMLIALSFLAQPSFRKLPVVGRWFSALQRREAERADRGIL